MENLTKSVNEVLKLNLKVKEVKEKNPIPIIDNLKELSDKIHKAKQAYEKAEIEFRVLEESLLSKTYQVYSSNAKDGNFSKSLNIEGESTSGIQVTYQDKFSSITLENEQILKSELKERFNTYFEEKRTIKLTDTGDESIKFLIDRLGQDIFVKHFTTEVNIVTKKDMDYKQFSLPEKPFKLIKQQKASVKLR